MTSIEEFDAIRAMLGTYYYGQFTAAAADSASVILVVIVWTTVSLVVYALLRGGLARLAVMMAFGIFGAAEIHHVLESVIERGYDPGVITSVPYAWAGALLVQAVWREYRRLAHAGMEHSTLTLSET